MTKTPILDVQNLQVAFHTRNGVVRAVEGVSLQVPAGKVVGIVGESGSGKSVSCYSLLGLIPQPPGRIEAGKAIFQGQDLLKLPEAELQKIRGNRISMIFQDPMSCLNPNLKIGTQLIEPLQQHRGMDRASATQEAAAELSRVGISDPESRLRAYPHEFSGGMRQRVMIAMALLTKPQLLLADEPTTALDVTVQKQVLDLLRRRQRDTGTSVVFITHDLAVVSEICDFVYVMYAGRIVEAASTLDLFSNPRHAYTRSLLKSIPAFQPKGQTLFTIPGMPPDLSRLPAGCAFRPRRPLEMQSQCLQTESPPFAEIAPGHWAQQCPGCLAS